MALAHAIHSVASLVMQTNKSILGHLKKECESIEANSDAYRYIADKFDTKFLYETIPLRKLGFSGMVIGLNAWLAKRLIHHRSWRNPLQLFKARVTRRQSRYIRTIGRWYG